MSRATEDYLADQMRQSEDDSPFLSMADFFSLISLTVIYIVIIFSPQSPANENAIEAITGSATGTGPASSIDNKVAYVALLAAEPEFFLRVVRSEGSPIEERTFSSSQTDRMAARDWVASRLLPEPTPERVIFYMDAKEERGGAHQLFNELVRSTQRRFPVSIVFLEDE